MQVLNSTTLHYWSPCTTGINISLLLSISHLLTIYSLCLCKDPLHWCDGCLFSLRVCSEDHCEKSFGNPDRLYLLNHCYLCDCWLCQRVSVYFWGRTPLHRSLWTSFSQTYLQRHSVIYAFLCSLLICLVWHFFCGVFLWFGFFFEDQHHDCYPLAFTYWVLSKRLHATFGNSSVLSS